MSSDRKLKVLFILDAFPDPHAGTEGQFWLLFNSLDRSRIEPAILLLRPSQFLSRNVVDCPVETLNVESLKSPRTLWRIAKAVLRARRAKYRIAHIFFNDSAIAFPLPLHLAGIRVIVSRRDLGFWYTRGNLPLLRFNRRFVDAAVANCEAVRRVVHAREAIPLEKIHVIYNGHARQAGAPRPDTRRSHGLPEGARLLVIVANLRPLKRNADAVRALARLPGQFTDVHLVLVGEDRDGDGGHSHRDELEQLARSLDVAHRVHFTGKQPDPMPLIAEASVCMLCSETEGLSNAIIEYMLAGKPVVCTDVGGNSELVVDGLNGFVVGVGDVDALAAALVRTMSDETQRLRLGAQSTDRASRLFGPSTMVARHHELYATLAGVIE